MVPSCFCALYVNLVDNLSFFSSYSACSPAAYRRAFEPSAYCESQTPSNSSLCKRLAILDLVRFGHGELEHIVNKDHDNKVRIDKKAGQTTQTQSLKTRVSTSFFFSFPPLPSDDATFPFSLLYSDPALCFCFVRPLRISSSDSNSSSSSSSDDNSMN